jgi:subtilisin
MSTLNKRYLVTYTHGNIDADVAVKVLGVSKANCKDGVAFMASESVVAENDVLHFENLGVSSIELTEDEAANLMLKTDVLAVEEDVEMFAIDSKNDEDQFNELFMHADSPLVEDDSYEQGYRKALLDMFSALLDLKPQNSSDALRIPIHHGPI